MSMKELRAPAAGWVAALLLAVPAAAAPQPDRVPSFEEIVDVRVINLEVVVTDGGERVPDLSPEDFRLLVDGQETPIEYFSEVRGGWAVEEGRPTSALPALAPGEAVGTRYLVFIDDYFAVPSYRDRVLRELAGQLPLMSADDRMAIVAFDGREVEMLTSWTRSLVELEAAFDKARERRAYGLQRLSEQRQFDSIQRFGRRGAGTRFASTGFARRGFFNLDGFELDRAEQVSSQVGRVADAATSVLRAFARPEGRKVMLLLSGGWPTSIAQWVTGTFDPVFESGRIAGYDLFEPVVETANRLGYTIYPVDLKGVAREAYGSAEFGGLAAATFASEQARNREQLEEETLYTVARRTGGRAMIDGAAYNALERAVEDTRSYYWLGFSPAWQEDDERHKVKVEVKRKGVKVRSRGSFSDLSRASELTMLVESAQIFDLPLPSETALGVSFGEPTGAGFKKVVLPVKLEIPLDYVTMVPTNGGVGAELEMRVAATDDSGDRADVSLVPVTLRGAEAAAAGQVAIFETELKLRRQPHRLLISLYDPSSGNLMSKRVTVSL